MACVQSLAFGAPKYTYHRISLLATVKVWRSTSVNLFVHHLPENHKLEDDDATTTLFSLDVSYSF